MSNFVALYNRGIALWSEGRFEEALASTDAAVAANPLYIEALYNRGVMLQHLRRPEQALASFDAALALKPDFVEALNNRAAAMQELGRLEEALASCDAALAISPRAGYFHNRGTVLGFLGRFDEAEASYESALTLDPSHSDAFGALASAAQYACDWPRTARLAGELAVHVAARKSAIAPFTFLAYSDNPVLQFQCARTYSADRIRVRPQQVWMGRPYRHDKIRVAYLSSDFQDHPVAFQIAELLERHDRARFEVIGISTGADDGGGMRTRLRKAFDRFHDMRAESDRAVAEHLALLEADIVVDLNGHTIGSRPGILSYRTAPVQVLYLGYPGTTGADFVDYVVADQIVLPFDRGEFFSEKIIHLPDTFWVSDSTRAIGKTPTRKEAGLPERGFVFCSFNNQWKITAPVFNVWMRLLDAVPGSVLWLKELPVSAKNNLCAEARARGIDPGRLIFAGRTVSLGDHLARHKLADLFLDTLPYNAHATASDALWAGVPLVTCIGQTFPGRVAASLLHTIGLPELVTENLRDYEALALELARDPAHLHLLRQKLDTNRLTHPLFDTDRFRRNLEAAYARMWQIAELGEAAKSFAVEP